MKLSSTLGVGKVPGQTIQSWNVRTNSRILDLAQSQNRRSRETWFLLL